MISQDFLKAQRYLTSLIPVRPKKVDLENIKYFLHLLGNPQKKFPSVHVGGTAGKGSTCFLISSLLSQAGYKVGLHLSPHLQLVNERMQIGDRLISEKRFCELVFRLKTEVEKMEEKTGKRPSYFEFLVVASFVYFAQEKVDLAVVEVGLGGRLDGTNVLNPLVSVITNVEKDHTEILGKTLAKIAQDKAGIIKEGTAVVSGVSQKPIQELLKNIAKEKKAKLLLLGRDFDFRTTRIGEDGENFDLKTPQNFYQGLPLLLLGNHQVKNASLAIAACEELKKFNFHFSEETARKTLSRVRFAGRLEKVQDNPPVFLDGAHNPAKMRALVRTLGKIFPKKKIFSVVAIKKGKDVKNIFKNLARVSDRFILTTFKLETDTGRSGENAFSPYDLAKNLPRGKSFLVEREAQKALRLALKLARRQDLVLVTGSLYLVGEVRVFWYSKEEILKSQTMFPQKENFYSQVYAATGKIPKGQVATYGQIAQAVNSQCSMVNGKKINARMVGWALHKNPFAPSVPCHRVVAADGHLHGFAQGLPAKKKLLAKEGVKVVNYNVDLRKYRCRLK